MAFNHRLTHGTLYLAIVPLDGLIAALLRRDQSSGLLLVWEVAPRETVSLQASSYSSLRPRLKRDPLYEPMALRTGV